MTSSPFTIRQANPRDIDVIFQYTIALHQHEDDGEIPPHKHFTINLKKWLLSELNNLASLFLIIEDKRIPFGFIGATSIVNDNGFLESPVKGVIQLLWVDKDYRNKHAANMLLEEVEKCFRELGIQFSECSYTVSNSLAESFWTKNGYLKSSITNRKKL